MSRSRTIAGLALVALVSLVACRKPLPPLLASGIDGMTHGARGLYDDDRAQATNLTALRVLADAGLRNKLSLGMAPALASPQGHAVTDGTLSGLGAANPSCPQRNTTEICTIFFGVAPPTPSTIGAVTPSGDPTMASGVIRFDAPYTDDTPPTDIPFQVPGAVVRGELITAGDASSAPYRCRTDSVPSAGIKRHICSIRWGVVKITFAHDVAGQVSTEDGSDLDEFLGDQPILQKLQQAGPAYLGVVAHADPQIWRTLAVRSEASSGPTLNGDENTVWALATTQSDWNVACSEAALRREPIVIYSLEDIYDPYAAIADAPVSGLADKAVLVAVLGHMSAADPWARAFNRAIGMQNAAMVTVTGIPVMDHDNCQVTRAYQTPAALADVDTVGKAIAAQ